ncbi:MAG: hypothetical protein ABR588_08820 [Sphingomicrobium sp.]
MLRDGLLLGAQAADLPMVRFDALSKAEVFARLAAEQGDAGDKVTLAALLLLQSSIYREEGLDEVALAYARHADELFVAIMQADDCEGRAMLLGAVSGLADSGDDLAALMLDNLVAAMPAEFVAATTAAIRKAEVAHG